MPEFQYGDRVRCTRNVGSDGLYRRRESYIDPGVNEGETGTVIGRRIGFSNAVFLYQVYWDTPASHRHTCDDRVPPNYGWNVYGEVLELTDTPEVHAQLPPRINSQWVDRPAATHSWTDSEFDTLFGESPKPKPKRIVKGYALFAKTNIPISHHAKS